MSSRFFSQDQLEILLVEDNESDFELFMEAFEVVDFSKDLRVTRVWDGREALDRALSEDQDLPALVLLDINLPYYSGFEVLEGIKKDPRARTVPVVMLTTSHRQEDVLRAYRNYAAAYVRKDNEFAYIVDFLRAFHMWWVDTAIVPAAVSGQ